MSAQVTTEDLIAGPDRAIETVAERNAERRHLLTALREARDALDPRASDLRRANAIKAIDDVLRKARS